MYFLILILQILFIYSIYKNIKKENDIILYISPVYLEFNNSIENEKKINNNFKKIESNLIKLNLIKKIENKYNCNKLNLLKSIDFNTNNFKKIESNLIKLNLIKKIENKYNSNKLNKDLEYYNISKKDLEPKKNLIKNIYS